MFFFSSRRRHTRFDCDWSSDVCSSDLSVIQASFTCADPRWAAAIANAYAKAYVDTMLELRVAPTRKAAAWFDEQLKGLRANLEDAQAKLDRKSTRLNSSHSQISYAVFCLKKKTNQPPRSRTLQEIQTRSSPSFSHRPSATSRPSSGHESSRPLSRWTWRLACSRDLSCRRP